MYQSLGCRKYCLGPATLLSNVWGLAQIPLLIYPTITFITSSPTVTPLRRDHLEIPSVSWSNIRVPAIYIIVSLISALFKGWQWAQIMFTQRVTYMKGRFKYLTICGIYNGTIRRPAFCPSLLNFTHQVLNFSPIWLIWILGTTLGFNLVIYPAFQNERTSISRPRIIHKTVHCYRSLS